MWFVFAGGIALILAVSLLLLPTVRHMRLALRTIKVAPKLAGEDALPEAATVLFITSTPGEAEFACGGTLAKLLERGDKMYLAVLTDGRRPAMPMEFFRKRAIVRRRSQQEKASAVAGFTDTLFYGLHRGSLSGNEKAVAMISTLVRELKPKTIFAFDPDAPSIEPDPPAAGAIAGLAAARSGQTDEIFYYMTERPNVIVDISDSFEAKLRLLSHFERSFGWRVGFRPVLDRVCSRYGRALGVKYGEGYLTSIVKKDD